MFHHVHRVFILRSSHPVATVLQNPCRMLLHNTVQYLEDSQASHCVTPDVRNTIQARCSVPQQKGENVINTLVELTTLSIYRPLQTYFWQDRQIITKPTCFALSLSLCFTMKYAKNRGRGPHAWQWCTHWDPACHDAILRIIQDLSVASTHWIRVGFHVSCTDLLHHWRSVLPRKAWHNTSTIFYLLLKG